MHTRVRSQEPRELTQGSAVRSPGRVPSSTQLVRCRCPSAAPTAAPQGSHQQSREGTPKRGRGRSREYSDHSKVIVEPTAAARPGPGLPNSESRSRSRPRAPRPVPSRDPTAPRGSATANPHAGSWGPPRPPDPELGASIPSARAKTPERCTAA